jgi:hypothetical protein
VAAATVEVDAADAVPPPAAAAAADAVAGDAAAAAAAFAALAVGRRLAAALVEVGVPEPEAGVAGGEVRGR